MKPLSSRARSLSAGLLIAGLLVACPAAAAPLDTAPTAAAQMEALLQAAYPADRPGAAAIVVKGGAVQLRRARGMASLELGVPLQPDMVFRLGSLTKQFTATAILMLVEDGKLALDDPVEKHLPDYPTQGKRITIEHLLTHTSGIQSYTDMPGWMTSKVLADMTVTQLIDGFKNEPMQFAPGEKYRYNNSAYVLLGAIVEKASGKTYEAFLQERIFGPLGMRSSGYGSNEPIIPKRVPGYTQQDDSPKTARYLSMTQPYSAGALISTVDDLARWDAALYTERLLKKASLDRMWTPFATSDGKSTKYGYGWAISELRGRRTVEHGGGIFGFQTYALRVPDERVYVAVLCNSDRPPSQPNVIAKKLAALAIGDPFPEPVAVKLDSSILERYVGVYRVDDETQRMVTLEDGRLFLQRTGGRRNPIKPSSETDFFFDESLTRLRFVVDPSGRTTELLVFPDGATEPERSPRTSDAVPEKPVAKVDPSVYDAYVGEYELAAGLILAVTREGDHLMTQATGQAKVEAFPSSETEFFLKVVDARITFVRGPDGAVDQLVLHQGGKTVTGRRVRR